LKSFAKTNGSFPTGENIVVGFLFTRKGIGEKSNLEKFKLPIEIK
jgi:hypothetical protein